MIADSVPWKEDLLRVADTLEKRKMQARWTGRTSFLVERDTMTAAYAVRKLIDSYKVSDELRREGIHVVRHDLVGNPVDLWTRYEFWEHYDMKRGRKITLSLSEFCNQIIHSWVFMLSATDSMPPRFDCIYVSSDHERKKYVYFVPVDTLVSVFRQVGMDEIVDLRMRTDQDGVRHIIKASRDLPPDVLSDLPYNLRDK